MPAPAVIPAPRAYINAVAVKGFVVELWGMILSRDPVLFPRSRNVSIILRERQKLRSRERFFNKWPPITRAMHAGGRPCSLL